MNEVSQGSIKDQLRKLVELQKIDSEIYELQVQLEEQPKILDDLKQEFESKKATLHGLETQVKDAELERKNLELELQTKEDGVQKADAQLSQLKTNKEYQAKLFEIDSLKADKSVIEDKILNSFDGIDDIKAQIEKEKEVVAAEEEKFSLEKIRIDELVADLETKIGHLKSTNKTIEQEVDPIIHGQYQKVLQARQGLAVVPILGQACGGCHMNVPPQTVNEVKMYQNVVACDNCLRLLYIEEEL